MNGSIIELRADTEAKIRDAFPVTLSGTDLDWAADLFLILGVATVSAALREHPELTIGDLIKIIFKLNDC